MAGSSGTGDRSKRRRPTIPQVAAAALASADSVLARWLPGGKRSGAEYVTTNPRRDDGRPGSFSVNFHKGAWADFATDDKGGDLVALVAYLEGCRQGEAADRLAAFLGLAGESAGATTSASDASPPQSDAVPVVPVPEDAPEAPAHHHRHGAPVAVWHYRDAQGRELFRVARFNTSSGKQVLPLSLWRENGRTNWRWKGLPEPRPLYGLDRLAAAPVAVVIVTEGEKDCDAAAALLPDLVAVTSPNGSKSAGKAEWRPIKGRRVLIWPDADKAGTGYARAVAAQCLGCGAASVAVLKREALAKLRGSALPTGWGAADALAEGIDRVALAGLLTDPAAIVEQQASEKRKAPAKAGDRPQPAFLTVSHGDPQGRKPGAYFVPVGRDRQSGEFVELQPEWVCSPLRVDSVTRDATGGEWGRLLVFPDRDGMEHRWAMPCSMLAKEGAELRERLLSEGLEITADPHRRRRIAELIQSAEPGKSARCVTRTGWHGDNYVLPIATFGDLAGETLVFQSATAEGAKLAEAGTLEAWRDTVAKPCAAHSRLVLALSAAFAGPCLALAGLEGGGLHLRGPSSCGKSTALALAASVYGPPEYRREWRATDNALESVAAMHSDALLLLDEIGQLDPKHAGIAAYLLSNGHGKGRARRDGGLRAPATWRLLFLSCGELGLGDLVAATGGRQRAGMEVRAVDLPADAGAGYGVFDTLPEGESAGALADRLRTAAAVGYGTAFPAFLRALVANPAGARRYLRDETVNLARKWVGNDSAGQVRRVAQRFALIGAAGELATAHKLTGWPSGAAEDAAGRCFADWLEARGGAGESEPREMFRAVQGFIGMHSEGRFTDMDRADDDRAPRTLAKAGWRVKKRDADGWEYWILPECWRNEVCKGFDSTAVARVLVERGFLKPDGKGFTRRERIKGTSEMVRVYRILPGILDAEP